MCNSVVMRGVWRSRGANPSRKVDVRWHCLPSARRRGAHSKVGGFMASGAKNQLPLVNDLGAPTLRDGSVGRWDGKESFFSDGFDVGGHP